jgi:hypothetical protein
MVRQVAILTISIVSVASHGQAQSAKPGATQDSITDPKPNWSIRASAAMYVLPDERAHHVPPDIQRGLLVGAALGKVEPVFYFFNPGSDDRFFVASIGVEF